MMSHQVIHHFWTEVYNLQDPREFDRILPPGLTVTTCHENLKAFFLQLHCHGTTMEDAILRLLWKKADCDHLNYSPLLLVAAS